MPNRELIIENGLHNRCNISLSTGLTACSTGCGTEKEPEENPQTRIRSSTIAEKTMITERMNFLLFKRFCESVSVYYNCSAMGIADYAKHLHCHRSTLVRVVTGEIGISPQTYLRKVRLERAKYMLEYTLFSIKQIALKCGFTNPDYFAKVFRQTYGKKPTAFR